MKISRNRAFGIRNGHIIGRVDSCYSKQHTSPRKDAGGNMTVGIEERIAQYIVNTRYEDLPADAIEYSKKSILDMIGSVIGGSAETGVREAIDLVKQWGGAEQATIWLYGGKVPVHIAGFAIAIMGRAKELGDTHEAAGGMHPSELVIPTAFPIAEYAGGVNGKRLITAVVLAQDIMARLGMTVKVPCSISGRNPLLKVIPPAVVSAKVLGLNKETTHNALGIAYSGGFTSIDFQQMIDGAMTMFLHYGSAVEGGIKSALLAQKGVEGTKNFLLGKWGFYNIYEPEHDLMPLTYELGKRFEGAYISTKPFPSCKDTHTTVSIVIDLVKEHDIRPQNIEEIDVGQSRANHEITFLPAKERYEPPNVVSARFSMPYTAAVAAIKRGLFLEDFTTEAIRRTDVVSLMRRVRGRVDPEIDKEYPGVCGPAIVKIRTKDKKEYIERLDYSKGHPENPMTLNEVAEEKLMKCLPFAAKPLPKENIQELINLVRNLEEVDDITTLIRLLV